MQRDWSDGGKPDSICRPLPVRRPSLSPRHPVYNPSLFHSIGRGHKDHMAADHRFPVSDHNITRRGAGRITARAYVEVNSGSSVFSHRSHPGGRGRPTGFHLAAAAPSTRHN